MSGLGDEKVRWEFSLANYRVQHTELVGDCILAAAYMSYCGPFPANYRGILHKNWMKKIKDEAIPHNKKFSFITILQEKSFIAVKDADGTFAN